MFNLTGIAVMATEEVARPVDKTGWHDETFRTPPDNVETVYWAFYGPPRVYQLEGRGIATTLENIVCEVYELDRTRWMMRAATPPDEYGRARIQERIFYGDHTIDEAKLEAQDLMRDLGWKPTAVSDAPKESSRTRGETNEVG